MVKLKYHSRYQRWRKGDVYGVDGDEESHSCLGFLSGNSPAGFSHKNGRPNNKLFYFAFLSFLYFTLIYLFSSSTFSFLCKHHLPLSFLSGFFFFFLSFIGSEFNFSLFFLFPFLEKCRFISG